MLSWFMYYELHYSNSLLSFFYRYDVKVSEGERQTAGEGYLLLATTLLRLLKKVASFARLFLVIERSES